MRDRDGRGDEDVPACRPCLSEARYGTLIADTGECPRQLWAMAARLDDRLQRLEGRGATRRLEKLVSRFRWKTG
jgi:hypothetical protein